MKINMLLVFAVFLCSCSQLETKKFDLTDPYGLTNPIEIGLCRSSCDKTYPVPPWASEHDNCIRRCENPTDTQGRSDSAPSTPQLNLSAEPDAGDLDIKNKLNATKVNIVTVGIYPNFRQEHNRVRASTSTDGLDVLATYVYLKNSSWPNNCALNTHDSWINVGPNSVNGLGWSSTGSILRNENVISVDFDNWSDCNRRGGKLVVYLK